MANNWLDTTEYPFTSNYFEVNGQQMHYIDEGRGETLLFIHGTPSWSFDFRHVMLSLRTKFRCIAIDHIGFGLSSKPADYDYSTQNHSTTLEKFIASKQLSNITLIVHDFGGPIGLHYAIQNPDKISRLIMLNTWLWSSKNDPEFIKLSKILKSPLLPFLYRYFNFSPRFILPNSFGDNKLPKRLLKQYTAPFTKASQRNGTIAFAKSLLNDQDWFETLWHRRHVLTDKPALIIWGMKDPAIKPHNLARLQSGFPHAHTLTLDTCGHFPQEEQPEAVIRAISTFIPQTD